ncbi:putative NUDIX hydrolase domain-containing protein [Helianthus annuus]|nr:putative NUDIX hydrolase domain-containing protein [Helianthus annuus]
MTSIVARTGRHLQRYDNNLRLVSGCIPYRLDKTKDQNRIEVLMVSSPNRDDMVFPKGGWESDETVEEAACREALEEAGVRGILDGNALGVWEFRSKSKQEACSEEGGCKGYMFALQVTEELETWPEKNNRNRKWVVIEEAFVLCRYEWMRNALNEFVKVIEKGENKREHKMSINVNKEDKQVTKEDEDCQLMPNICHVNGSMSINVNKEDKQVTKEDEDCQLMSNICHVNGSMSTYGIMVPARIFL